MAKRRLSVTIDTDLYRLLEERKDEYLSAAVEEVLRSGLQRKAADNPHPGWRVVCELNDGYSHIAVDDGCYVLLNGGKPSAWWFPEALQALKGLPADPRDWKGDLLSIWRSILPHLKESADIIGINTEIDFYFWSAVLRVVCEKGAVDCESLLVTNQVDYADFRSGAAHRLKFELTTEKELLRQGHMGTFLEYNIPLFVSREVEAGEVFLLFSRDDSPEAACIRKTR